MYLKNKWWKLLPLLIPFSLMFIYGIGITIFQSLGYFTPVESNFRFLAAYKELFRDSWFLTSFIYSLYIALVSGILSIIIGSIMAYGLWKMKTPGLAETIYKVPLILPHIVAAFFVQYIFSKTGLISSILYNLGVIESFREFPNITYSSTGIILAYIYKEVPFVMLMQMGIYSRIDRRLIETASNLGATPTSSYFKIILPMLKPITNTSFIIIFLYSFGAFEIPFIIGGSRPEMISVLIYNLYFKSPLKNRPVAMAALFILFIFAMIFVVIYSFVTRKIESSRRSV